MDREEPTERFWLLRKKDLNDTEGIMNDSLFSLFFCLYYARLSFLVCALAELLLILHFRGGIGQTLRYYIDMTINEVQDEIIDEMSGMDDWLDRYAYIIDLGNTLPPIHDDLKTPQNLIEGCQSRVWIDAKKEDDRKIHFEADSDALIVKGIVALLMRVLNDRTPDEILDSDLYFIDRIGLREHLSPTRSNGLVAMTKQIRNYAKAFKLIDES